MRVQPNPSSEPRYGPGAISERFRRCGLTLSKQQAEKLWIFHTLLRKHTEELDLTRLRSFESIVVKHYIDSALVLAHKELPSPLLDVGTGAGFPGLVLKILRDDLQLLLSEGRGRRVRFLSMACEALGLQGVRIIPHRITPRFTEPVRAVICRGVGSIQTVLRAVRNCLRPGGEVIFMKGPSVGEELAQLPPCEGFSLAEVTRYHIPQTPHRRCLVVFRRKSAVSRIRTIESKQNKRFKRWKGLLTSKGIRTCGRALFAGRKIIPEVLTQFAGRIESCLVRKADAAPSGLPPEVPVFSLAPELFGVLDVAGTRGPLLVVAVRGEFPPWQGPSAETVSVLLALQDPTNLGAATRVCCAFGVKDIVLLQEAAHPFLPKSIRAAGTPVLKARFFQGPSLRDLAGAGGNLIALRRGGTPLAQYPFPGAFSLVLGSEGSGLPAELNSLPAVAIPQSSEVESLNAVTALAVALYAYRLRHPLAREEASEDP